MHKFAMSAGALALASGSAFGVVTAFDDQSAWEAAAGGAATVDDLSSYGVVSLTLGSNGFFNGYSIDLAGTDDGNTNVNSATNLAFTLNGGLDSITFVFDQPVLGFGGVWLNTFVSNGLSVTIDGQTFNVEDTVAAPDFEFVGYASDTPFTTATLTATNPSGGTEFAAISDVLFVVPTPASAAMLGLGGLAMVRRRR